MTIRVSINHTTCYYDFKRRFENAYHEKLKIILAVSWIAICVQDDFLSWIEENKEKISNYLDVKNWILNDKKDRVEKRKKTSAIYRRRIKLINNQKIDDKYKIDVDMYHFFRMDFQFEKIGKINSYWNFTVHEVEKLKEFSNEKLHYLLKLCNSENTRKHVENEIASRQMALVF